MTRKCYVCKKRDTQATHFFSLPKNLEVKNKWLKWISNTLQCNINSIPTTALLCSNHFNPDHIMSRKLKAGSVPESINYTNDNPSSSTSNSSRNPVATTTDGSSAISSNNNPTTSNSENQQMERLSEYTSVIEIDTGSDGISQVSNYSSLIEIDTFSGHVDVFPFADLADNVADLFTEATINNGTITCIEFIEENNNKQLECDMTCDMAGVNINPEGQFQTNFECIQANPATSTLGKDKSKPERKFIEENNNNLESDITYNMAGVNINPEGQFQTNLECCLGNPATNTLGKDKSKPVRKTTSRKCAALNCHGSLTNKFFTYPSIMNNNTINYKNLDRCMKWIKNSGNTSLLNIETSKLHSAYYLCSEHFSTDMFYCIDRKTLLPTAIPTEFVNDPLSDEQMLLYPKLSRSQVLLAPHLYTPCVPIETEQQEDETNILNNQIQDNLQIDFENYMNTLKWETCPKCKEKFCVPASSNTKCLHGKNNCKYYTEDNDMDPFDVPKELNSLSYVEEQLIALVHPIISVFKLSGHHQYGYKGNIINFPQDVKGFARTLPHNIETLSSLITVRTGDDIKPVDFHVRAGKVRDALLWLKENNCYYTDIEISEDNISKLPEDGNVFDHVTHVINVDKEEEEQDEPTEIDDEDVVNIIMETCVPSISLPSSTDKAESILKWPTIGKDAINEFKTPGYIAMAFPTLFPYGKADLRNPREHDITPKQYFKHLMNYHDGRFAKHPRFKYFALNSEMRWNALKLGGVFVKKNSEFQDMNMEELKEKLQQNPALLKKILFYNSSLRGTRSYWYARGQELLTMIEQLGLPTLFFTLSAADLHWPDLFHNIAPDEDLNTMTESRRRKLIEENPLKVDAFFLKRGEKFIYQVLREKYDVDDLWFRIEYQHRGSPHIHGVLWLKNAPKFEDLTMETPERRQEIADYFEQFISTTHPDIQCPKGPVHPCRKRLSEVVDLEKDLAELLNRVQRHTEHRDGYCMRTNKKTKKKECRFKFPKELSDKTEIRITEDNDVELITARNDPCLNKYNQYFIQTWRANIDVSPVLSKRALVNYLAKYVTKSEIKSKEFTDILEIIMNRNNSDKSVKSIIQQLYIQSCCERDISAQETCHLLMGLDLTSKGGRQFVSINFRVLDSDGWVPITDDENRNSKTYIEKYIERPALFENESLWHMAKHIILPKGRKRSRGKEALIQVYPKLSKSSLDVDPEAYYRQKVLLFVPWRCEDSFMQQYNTWEEAYRVNEALIIDSFKPACDLDGKQPDEPEYDDLDDGNTITTEQWMCVSRMGPSNTAEKIELGRRDVDLSYDWHQDTIKYQQYGSLPELTSFLSTQKKNSTTAPDVPLLPSVQFTTEQQSVLDLLKLQIEAIRSGNSAKNLNLPKSVIVQGKAGTGKSLLIHAMKSIIHNSLGSDAFCLLGPTGVSALNINGSTIHSKLYIHPKTRQVLPLKGTALHEFRKCFENIHFVLIDEYSMVGCNMLNLIEKRLKEALDRDNEPYGGVFTFFFGDIQQLAPVGDSAPYKNNQVSIDYINGKLLYNTVDAAMVLSQVKRQNDTRFLDVLNNISSGTLTDVDYNILQQRFSTSVPEEERKKFKDAIHLFPTRAEVDEHNKNCLEALKYPITRNPIPIARIPGKHNCSQAKDGSDNEAGGLRNTLYLAKGAKVMLRANLWTEKGLVNGSVGEVVDILYSENTSPPDDAPVAIICKFDSYKGPFLDNIMKTVVITPITKQWKNKNGQDCVREQFPLSLCYACSIHKSQGLTLDQVYVNIGPLKEMSPGLTYTALSRVRSLKGLLLEPFGKKRMLSMNSKTYIQERLQWINDLNDKRVRL